MMNVEENTATHSDEKTSATDEDTTPSGSTVGRRGKERRQGPYPSTSAVYSDIWKDTFTWDMAPRL